MNDDSPKFLTPKQLARRWAISPAAAYRLLGNELPVVRIGRASLRIPIEAVERYEGR